MFSLLAKKYLLRLKVFKKEILLNDNMSTFLDPTNDVVQMAIHLIGN